MYPYRIHTSNYNQDLKYFKIMDNFHYQEFITTESIYTHCIYRDSRLSTEFNTCNCHDL